MIRSLTEEEALAFSNGTAKAEWLTVPVEQLQNEVARRMNLYPEDVETVLHATMEAVLDFLVFADREKTVRVYVDKDLYIVGRFEPAHVVRRRGKQTGDDDVDLIYIDDAIEVSPRVSKAYKEKCNKAFLDRLDLTDMTERFKKELEQKQSNEDSASVH